MPPQLSVAGSVISSQPAPPSSDKAILFVVLLNSEYFDTKKLLPVCTTPENTVEPVIEVGVDHDSPSVL